jgi:threonine/homoserine/homoserine lactone efflux protein
MTLDHILALALSAAVTVFAPGRNNAILTTSGADFAVSRTLPHLAGVADVFPLMILPVGLGVMQLFEAWPPAFTLMKLASALHLSWLAWRIGHQAVPGDRQASARPLTFLQAAAFQWVTPKAKSMARGVNTRYAASRDLAAVARVAGTCAVIGTASAMTWTVLGTGLRRWLAVPGRLRLVNRTMAVLLLLVMAPVLLG